MLGLIPLHNFLLRIEMSLKDYLSLKEVPYPLVTKDGDVIYFENDFFYKSWKRSTEPSDNSFRGKKTLEALKLNNDLYIDIRKFVPYLSSTKYRNKEIIKDTLCKISLGYVTETTSSSIQIDHNLDGKENIILLPNYLFSPLDLVNTVDKDFLINFESEKPLVFNETKCNFELKQTSEGNIMSQVSPLAPKSILDKNKDSLVLATKLEVGGLALDLVSQQVVKTIPEPFQPLVANNVFFKIAIANAINLLVLQTNMDDERIKVLNDSMMTKAYIDMLGSFDLSKLLGEILTKLPVDKVQTLVNEKETKTK